jgi:hypothetical protein
MKDFIDHYMNHPDYAELVFNALGPQRPPPGYKVFAERATDKKYFWITKDAICDERYQYPPYAFIAAWKNYWKEERAIQEVR